MTIQLSPTTHVSACESNSILDLLLATEACTVTQMVVRGSIKLFFSSLDWLSPFDSPDHHATAWLCLVLLPFFVKGWILGFSSRNKLSLLLCSVFASSVATLASKALLLSGVFFFFKSPALYQSSFNCCCSVVDIGSYSSLEHFLNSIFPLKVPWLGLVICHLADLV